MTVHEMKEMRAAVDRLVLRGVVVRPPEVISSAKVRAQIARRKAYQARPEIAERNRKYNRRRRAAARALRKASARHETR